MQIEAASPSSSEKKSPPCRSSVLLMAANMVALEPKTLNCLLIGSRHPLGSHTILDIEPRGMPATTTRLSSIICCVQGWRLCVNHIYNPTAMAHSMESMSISAPLSVTLSATDAPSRRACP